MTEYELMKLSEKEEEAINLSDYTTEQIMLMASLKEKAYKQFKEKYFDYYDDVKDSTLKKQDW